MFFRKGQKIEIFKKSDDEQWASYMDEYIGCHGIIVDPDTVINDPDALIEVSLEDKGTHRFPQDCIRLLEESGQV
jgi:hypothetical protein